MSDHQHNWATIKHWGKGAIADHLAARHGIKREDLEGRDLLETLYEAHGVNVPEEERP